MIDPSQIQTETPYYQPNPAAPVPFPYVASYNDPMFPTDKTIEADGYTIPNSDAWALRIVDSSNIAIYGAGLYSFFDNYSTDCSNQGKGETCQSRITSIENSAITMYNLNTVSNLWGWNRSPHSTCQLCGGEQHTDGFLPSQVGTHYMITVDGKDVAYYKDNLDGFVDTIALFRSSQGSAPQAAWSRGGLSQARGRNW